MTGLDPESVMELKNLIFKFKENRKTILISTHLIDTIKTIADRIVIMNKGKFAADFSVKEKTVDIEKYFMEVISSEV